MEFENLLTLIKTVSESQLTELQYQENGTSICLKKKKETVVVSGDSSGVPIAGLAAAQTATTKNVSDISGDGDIDQEPSGQIVKSPLVGTFYAAPSEDGDPFVTVGDSVKKGQTLAIVEAMKLMNEIESDFDCEIEAVLVSNEQRVEYGQPLFKVKKLDD